MPTLLDQIEEAHDKLFSAVMRQRSERHCLRLWSQFIRTRDAGRCVVCYSTKNLSAHHIVRKSFFPQARLQRGNGITLCGDCHREPHKVFNGRPDMGQPMDAQGGDDNDLIMEYFGLLLKDATERNLLHTNYYFLHDRVLETFKRCLGFPADCQFPGTPLEQAYLIWMQTPPGQQAALMHANGFNVSARPQDYIKLPGISIRHSA